MPTLAEIADELYGLLPAEFTAARNVWVRALKDETDTELAERVSVLRKASPAAWGVNLLARHRSDELAQLADLGALMRQAQSDLDRDQLAELTSQRRRLVSALAREAAELAADAHHVLTSSALDEVAATLQAALGDPAAAAAVRSGRLVRPLVGDGVEPVDLDDAVAAPEASMVSAVPAGEVIAREDVLGMSRPAAATMGTTISVVRLPGSPPTQCLSTTTGDCHVSRSPVSTIARVSDRVSSASMRSPAQAVTSAARCRFE